MTIFCNRKPKYYLRYQVLGIYSLCLLSFGVSCTTSPNITWSESGPTPTWIEHVPRDEAFCYYLGKHVWEESLVLEEEADQPNVSAERAWDHSIQQGQEKAIHDAYHQIFLYLESNQESCPVRPISDINGDQIPAYTEKTNPFIQNVTVENNYHKVMTRLDKLSVLKHFNVYVLVKYPKSEVIKNRIHKQQQISKYLQHAYDLHKKASEQYQNEKFYEALASSYKAFDVLSNIRGVIPHREYDSPSSLELVSSLKALEKESLSKLKHVVVWVNETSQGKLKYPSLLATSLVQVLRENAFSVLQEQAPQGFSAIPTFNAAFKGDQLVLSELQEIAQLLIIGQVSTVFDGKALNKFFFNAKGTLRVFQTSSGDKVLTIPIEKRGYHREKVSASNNALTEAGREVGELLVKEFSVQQ